MPELEPPPFIMENPPKGPILRSLERSQKKKIDVHMLNERIKKRIIEAS
jgi:hypothetical protein